LRNPQKVRDAANSDADGMGIARCEIDETSQFLAEREIAVMRLAGY
jgi:hypothetical protein